jgi:hypothetical protein
VSYCFEVRVSPPKTWLFAIVAFCGPPRTEFTTIGYEIAAAAVTPQLFGGGDAMRVFGYTIAAAAVMPQLLGGGDAIRALYSRRPVSFDHICEVIGLDHARSLTGAGTACSSDRDVL